MQAGNDETNRIGGDMGHYSDYYAYEAERRRIQEHDLLKRVLRDLVAYRQYNAAGKTGTWTFSDAGVEKEYEQVLNKIKARLYDLLRGIDDE